MSRLFWRLFAWFCIANLLTLLLTALLTERVTTSLWLNRQPDWTVVAEATLLHYQKGGEDELERWQSRLRFRGVDAYLVDGAGKSLVGGLPAPLSRRLPRLLGPDPITERDGPRTWIASVPLDLENGSRLTFVAIRSQRHRPPAVFPIGLQLTVAVLVIAAVGLWLSRTLTRPIHALQRTARAVAEGHLNARVGPPHTEASDEIGQLARDFDTMAGRIETLVEHTRGLLHDVSHELRSPLARLQLALEIARRGQAETPNSPIDRAQREVQRLDRVIGEVLALTRLETAMPDSGHETLRLDQIVEARLAEYADRSAERDQPLIPTLAPVLVRGNATLLGRALDNLIDNAFKFGPAGIPIEVIVRSEGPTALIEVADSGPGICEDDAAQLLRPFFRGRAADRAPGQGMGLAIVDRVARLHHGEVQLMPGEAGGTLARLSIPLTQAAPDEV